MNNIIDNIFTYSIFIMIAIPYYFFYGMLVFLFWPFFLARWFIVSTVKQVLNESKK